MSLTYEDLTDGADSGRSTKITDNLDQVLGNSGVGFVTSAIGDTFRGINHLQQPNSVPINRDYYGLTFFTRPRMNMTTDNLRRVRKFAHMLTDNGTTIPRAIRAMLDTEAKVRGHSSPLIDDVNAFIPILTNQMVSNSGWPDMQAQTFTSEPGLYKEEFSIVDGITDIYRTWDLRVNFRNISGDPITQLFTTWLEYKSLVVQGLIVPYPDAVFENELDYTTRIYRLILDHTKTYVQKIAACGAAFPLDSPIGNAFNYESDRPMNQGNDQITVSFRCMGAMYNDPILVDEFNRSVIMHNTDMGGEDRDREERLVKLSGFYQNLFNHRGYPRINPNDYQLEWWVPKDLYTEYVKQYVPGGAVSDDEE
jgi:hypothetical protein